MYSKEVTSTSGSTEDGFSLCGYTDHSVFLNDAASVIGIVVCFRGQCLLPKKHSVNTVTRERETVRSGCFWLRVQGLSVRIKVTKSYFNLTGASK